MTPQIWKELEIFLLYYKFRKNWQKKLENFHQLLKPRNFKQLKNYFLLLQIQGKNDLNLEIFTELSKPQNWSKFQILVYYCKFSKIWPKFGKICQTLKTTKLVKIQWPPLIVTQFFFLEHWTHNNLAKKKTQSSIAPSFLLLF